ncbi:ABC transporter substrate-binding protein [Cupriavidus basilensis OR16]|uniref:ABC transporter substrate-binding protein n=1 Tax=Cupriavidus basilensis OR16 TaxID=1127483 RepID=H1RZP4_9BURK|nr:MlaD family protein [Cupriavidus basilensis]EHP44110.1 ABC transporter substrate-binding protein [Cupriavidus basilensis OR16]
MKNGINTKARLAFVVFVLIAISVGAAWYAFSVSHYATYQIYTKESVTGLIADAPVEFHGVDVGKVKSISLVNPRSVSIVVSIDKDAPVTSASVATVTSRGLATRGFTGYVYISIEDVGSDSRPLTTRPGAPYPIIPTAPSNLITLDTTLNQVKENFQIITDLLVTILDTKTVASLKQSAESLQLATNVLAKNTEKLNSIVANTERASQRLEPLLQSSHDTVRALQTQILPEAYKALANIDNLSTSLTDLTTKINRDPSSLIRGIASPPPGPGEKK